MGGEPLARVVGLLRQVVVDPDDAAVRLGLGYGLGGGERLAGPSTVAVLNRDGIRVESQLLSDFTASVRAAERLADKVDVVSLTVKAMQLDEALDRLPADVVG